MTREFKVGDTVLVPWGVATEITATILEVWGDPPAHLKIRLDLGDPNDEDEDPSVILISPSSVLSAA